MSMFARLKDDHNVMGHDLWMEIRGQGLSATMLHNVCTDLKCAKAPKYDIIPSDRVLPGTMMEILLDNSCSNPREEGYSSYIIELHCATYEVIAKKVMGHWVIKSYDRKA